MIISKKKINPPKKINNIDHLINNYRHHYFRTDFLYLVKTSFLIISNFFILEYEYSGLRLLSKSNINPIFSLSSCCIGKCQRRENCERDKNTICKCKVF